jgi:hypothetical protein
MSFSSGGGGGGGSSSSRPNDTVLVIKFEKNNK